MVCPSMLPDRLGGRHKHTPCAGCPTGETCFSMLGAWSSDQKTFLSCSTVFCTCNALSCAPSCASLWAGEWVSAHPGTGR